MSKGKGDGMKNTTQPSKQTNMQQLYEKKGYTSLSHRDLGHRFLSFLIDICVMLAPIMIWDIIMMAVLGSVVSIAGIVAVTVIIGILLLASVLFVNAFIYVQTKGQSFGMRNMGFMIIRLDGNRAGKGRLIAREVIGFDIPFIILMVFFNIFGVIVYWALNGVVMLIDKRQRTLVDFIMRTCVVGIGEGKQRAVAKEAPVQHLPQEEGPQKSRIDLHIHSTFSANGEYNIEEIFQIAARNHMKTISITDMNCAKTNGIAMRMSSLYHMNYVPGIEINCDYHGRRIRILGYFIQYNSELYATIENESLMNEKKASIARVHKFEQLIGKKIDVDRLLNNNRFQKISGELIARHVLSRSEYMDCDVLQPYLHGDKKDRPYYHMVRDFFVRGKPCYVAVKYPLLEDILEVISLTGGKSVLAYPGKMIGRDPALFDEVIKKGIQGIEVFYSSHTKKEMSALMRYAMEHQLFITEGSGFSREQDRAQIGECNCPKDAEVIVQDFIDANM